MNTKENRYKVDLDRFRNLVNEKGEEGVSRQMIADALGYNVSQITLHYNGQRPISMEAMIKYARYFDVTTDYLLGLTDAKRPPDASDNAASLRMICDYTGLEQDAVEKLHEYKDLAEKELVAGFAYHAKRLKCASEFLQSDCFCSIVDRAVELTSLLREQSPAGDGKRFEYKGDFDPDKYLDILLSASDTYPSAMGQVESLLMFYGYRMRLIEQAASDFAQSLLDYKEKDLLVMKYQLEVLLNDAIERAYEQTDTA